MRVEEAVHMWVQEVGGKSLYLHSVFSVHPKLLYKINSIKKKLTPETYIMLHVNYKSI